ncbi:hypothetical protein LINPERPRIM_LOCUS17335 [Linum perenne]
MGKMVSGFSLDSQLAAFALALSSTISFSHAYQSSSAPSPFQQVELTERQQFEIMSIAFATMALLAFLSFSCCYIFQKRTILMVQVVLSARAGDIGIVLHEIATSPRREQSKLSGAVRALLEHQKSFVYGSTSAKMLRGHNDSQISYSLKKFVKKQMKKQGTRQRLLSYIEPKPTPKQDKDYTMVTIMAAVKGNQELPSIDTFEDVKEALNSLVTKLRSARAEVIWSHGDPLSMEKLHESFPNLNSILV